MHRNYEILKHKKSSCILKNVLILLLLVRLWELFSKPVVIYTSSSSSLMAYTNIWQVEVMNHMTQKLRCTCLLKTKHNVNCLKLASTYRSMHVCQALIGLSGFLLTVSNFHYLNHFSSFLWRRKKCNALNSKKE